MGNNIKEKLANNIYEMKNLIHGFNYDKSKEIYKIIQEELSKIKKGENILNIQNYLLQTHIEQKTSSYFSTLISNLKPEHKLVYLFQLIYENELINSVEIKKEVEVPNSKIIKKEKKNTKDTEAIKEDIKLKMNRIVIVNNYIEFQYFKSIMFEKIAEEYFNLGKILYSNFTIKKKQISEELQEIVDIFNECMKNYEKTENQKTKMEEYSSALQRVTSHQNLLKGDENLLKEEYLAALDFYKKVNVTDMTESKNRGIYLCYEKLAEKEEENKNYEKAIEYYILIDNNFKIYELNIKINEQCIIDCIKTKNFEKIFE